MLAKPLAFDRLQIARFADFHVSNLSKGEFVLLPLSGCSSLSRFSPFGPFVAIVGLDELQNAAHTLSNPQFAAYRQCHDEQKRQTERENEKKQIHCRLPHLVNGFGH